MLSSAGECGVGGEELVAVAGELAFEAAHGFAFAFAAREQAVVVGACLGVAAEAGAGDHVQGGWGRCWLRRGWCRRARRRRPRFASWLDRRWRRPAGRR